MIAVVFAYDKRQLLRQMFLHNQLDICLLVQQHTAAASPSYQLTLALHQHRNHVAAAGHTTTQL